METTTDDRKVALEMDGPLPPNLAEEWGKFLSNEGSRAPHLDSYAEVFSNNTLFPLQRMRETEQMMRAARSVSPKVVYEIGTDKGGGLYHWIKCLPSVERVIACEIRGTPFKRQFESAFPHIQFLWVEESSYAWQTIACVTAWLDSDPIDVLFIDGDKSMFLEDFKMYRPLMSRGGIVFMHDITDPAPGEAWACVKGSKRYRTEEIIDRSEAEEQIRMSAPPRSAYEGWLRHWRGKSCGVGVIHLNT